LSARLQPVPEGPFAAPHDLEITEVRVRLHRGRKEGHILRAFASITLNNSFAVHVLKVIEKDGVMFVSMPARRERNGDHNDIAHPTNRAFRQYMESVVLTEYERELAAAGDCGD
jgi:stage V sporulation protein G